MGKLTSVAQWRAEDRAELFTETAARTGITSPIAIEKDYWVCWALDLVFQSAYRDVLVFKGGTSLSKVYRLVDRFSEDIDLSVARTVISEHPLDPRTAPSRAEARRIIDAIAPALREWAAGPFLREIAAAMSHRLIGESVDLRVDGMSEATLLFAYPRAFSAEVYGNADYIMPTVRLELGARSEPWPVESREITSYCADAFPDTVRESVGGVRTLAAERTFWEKATILHAEYHRPKEKALPARLARHYFDMAVLAESAVGSAALDRRDLLETVVENKSLFFASGWANYHTARSGTLRLLPAPERVSALGEDYRKMREMFFGEPPSFEDLLDRLAALEARVNGSL